MKNFFKTFYISACGEDAAFEIEGRVSDYATDVNLNPLSISVAPNNNNGVSIGYIVAVVFGPVMRQGDETTE